MPDQCSGKLYEALNVAKEATPNEIKKAYHKKALLLHPDKTGGTTTEEFKIIQEANATLSDPEKRKLYDTFGRAGMAKLEQYGMGGAAATAMANPLVIRAIAFLFFLIFFLCLLFVALVVAKIDEEKTWSWAATFTPAWILFSGSITGPFIVIASLRARRFKEAVGGLAAIGVLLSTIFFVRVLDGHMEWKTFFIMLFCTASLFYLSELMGLYLPTLREFLIAQGHPAGPDFSLTSPLYLQMVLKTVVNLGTGMAFFVLMYLRLGGSKPDMSFYTAFAPLFANIAAPMIISFVMQMREMNTTLRNRLALLLVMLLAAGASLYTFVMISVKLQKEMNEGVDGPKAGVCAIMLFIVFGLLVLASCCGCACVGAFMNAEAMYDEEAAFAGVPRDGENDGAAQNQTTPATSSATQSANEGTNVIVTSGDLGKPVEEPSSSYNSLD